MLKHVKFLFIFMKPNVRYFQTTGCLQKYTIRWSPNAALNKTVLDKYLNLPIPECLSIVKYVWIEGTGRRVRGKSRTLDYTPVCAYDIPKWGFNGAYTYHGKGECSDMVLVPVAMYNDPFRMGNCRLCLCEVYSPDGKPALGNNRASCHETLKTVCEQDVWFGIQQQFTLVDADKRPFGWPAVQGYTRPRGPFYCGVGADRAYGRDIIESFYRCCLYAGVYVSSTNSLDIASRWKFTIGPSQGIRSADDLWMARFILHRVAEEFGVSVKFSVKPDKFLKSLSMHVGMSNCVMRCDDGLEAIEGAIKKLEQTHTEDLKSFDARNGKDNERRGEKLLKFSSGVENRKASIRIPRNVAEEKKGYFEDLRPASNADPYKVCEVLANRCLK